jgi:hypothetical protein
LASGQLLFNLLVRKDAAGQFRVCSNAEVSWRTPQRDAVEPQADGDSSSLDTVPVDGRISGPPPSYNETDEAIDSPAMDAKIQSDQQKDSEDSDDLQE